MGWLVIKISSRIVFPDPEPPIMSILCGWSGTFDQFELCTLVSSLVRLSELVVLQNVLVFLYLYYIEMFFHY